MFVYCLLRLFILCLCQSDALRVVLDWLLLSKLNVCLLIVTLVAFPCFILGTAVNVLKI